MLIAALACGMAWLVNPGYSITWQGIFSNDNLFFGAMMLFISIYLLAVTFAEDPCLRRSLPRFHFGLRNLLVIVTIAAVLLGIGPFGYTTLLVGLVGAIVFATVYFVYRPRGGSQSL